MKQLKPLQNQNYLTSYLNPFIFFAPFLDISYFDFNKKLNQEMLWLDLSYF